MKKINVGIIGLGNWAMKTHLPFLLQQDFINQIAVCDIDMNKKLLPKNNTFIQYNNFEDILDSNIDAIIISTPHNLHFDFALRALKKGLHVHVDKPLADSFSKTQKLIRIAAKRNLILNTHTQKKHESGLHLLHERLPEIGEIKYIYGAIWQNTFKDFINSWRSDINFASGGILMDSGFHIIDTILYLINKNEAVEIKDIENIHAIMKSSGNSMSIDLSSILSFNIRSSMVQISAFRGVPDILDKEEYQFLGSQGLIGLTYRNENNYQEKNKTYTLKLVTNEIYKRKANIDPAYQYSPLKVFFDAIRGDEYSCSLVNENVKISSLTIYILQAAYRKNRN